MADERDCASREGGYAIVGLAARFPGAADVATFWRNLCAGKESVERFDLGELEDVAEPATRAGRDYVAARSVLDDADRFDAAFFHMHSREAELTDPQHRVLLECAWSALEDAGYDPEAYWGAIGVVAGCSISSYFLRHVLQERSAIDAFTSNYQVGSFPELLGSGHDFLATRIAYKLNLQGPALTVQSACSTSLVAVVQACQQLELGQADMMLAGAASITFPQKRGYQHQAGGMVSDDGHCRTFDAKASGTVFGSGAGVIALKRLADARVDGDSIYAVIRGFGMNNDGSKKIGYTAPSVEGQAAAIGAAHRMAGFDPSSIAYVECHGTATPLGDPIEVAGLQRAFAGVTARATCALGSVKTNIGHLDVAAGMSGIIKTALAIRHGAIPPTLHFETPNPRIALDGGPFYVNTSLAPWPDDRRRAGVSAFGLGGTNVHIVLEAEPEPRREPLGGPHLFPLSARSEAALVEACENVAAHLENAGDDAVSDAAFTLQTGRRAFAHRVAVTASSAVEAAAKLRASRAPRGQADAREPRVAFLFPGQGAQFSGMGRALYERVPVFRDAIDYCGHIVAPIVGDDLAEVLYGPDEQRTTAALARTDFAQPAIFAVEYAVAQTWMAWGIAPAVMIGHSVGEFVAATLAGVMSVEDAIALVAERGRIIQGLPGGAMLAVRLPAPELAALLRPSLQIAAINTPVLSVAAGPLDAIGAIEAELTERAVPHTRLGTSHAFHSAMMDGAVAPLVERARGISLSEPLIPYVSGVTGTWITAADATSPEYWGRHCREAVRFADGIGALLDDGVTAWIEAGPGSSLGRFVAQIALRAAPRTVVASLPAGATTCGYGSMLDALGRLWADGAVRPEWRALHGADRRRISLPTYPFERKRYWIDVPATPKMEAESMNAASSVVPSVGVPAPAETGRMLQRTLTALLEELSGERLAESDFASTFLELGFDSLFLGRFAQQLKARCGINVTFRQLLSDVPSIEALTAYGLATSPPISEPEAIAVASVGHPVVAAPSSAIESLMREQVSAMQQLFRDQLAVLRGSPPVASTPSATPPGNEVAPRAAEGPSRLDVYRVAKTPSSSEITPAQSAFIDALIARTLARTAGSRAHTQRYRAVLADPRTASGFRSEWKEMVYPITAVRAYGSRLWDVDGNEYVDIVNGFGQTFFGHAPDFVVDAVAEQMKHGFAIGPQTELAGEVAELFCEITGNERVTFCNTGSEAVMAAMRVARTVTGRDRIVVFSGAYHGQFDEVLVKGARTEVRSLPAAPGIPAESVANMTVLSYGSDESLTWIRAHADELAAVIVEPVQSRHPELQPAAFLRELRAITDDAGTALIFDEVVTGFRMDPGGMQHVFGVRADLATYGKVIGGGLPIGILAGSARFMDALDGGMWAYGDASFPAVAPTFFAGTFVRHPLVMAAVKAVLLKVKEHGRALQAEVSARTMNLVERLNAGFAARGIASSIEQCGSLFYVNLSHLEPLASLLYFDLRARGIYILEGFPCFLTTEHGDADVDRIVCAFGASLDELQTAGIFAASVETRTDDAAAGVPLTEEQIEIWLAAQLGDDASRAFNESVTLRLSGMFNAVAFQRAWDGVVARHDALRTTFEPTGEAMQAAGGATFPYELTDVSAADAEERERRLAVAVDREARTAFDMVRGPLVRGHLVRLSPDEHAFVLTAHHIVCDGWSINVVLEEFAALYTVGVRGTEDSLPAPLSFHAYAREQRRRDPDDAARVERFWLERFVRPVTPLDIPSDRPRPVVRTFAGATRSAYISRERCDALKRAGAGQGCTLFVTLIAAFATLMGRLANQRDVVVGVPAAGQAALDDAILVGHCVHFLPLRVQWSPQDPVSALLASVKRCVMDAYDHQDYTLGTLVRTLALPRTSGRLPLTEIQFNLERLADGLSLPGLSATVVPNAKAYVNFDLFMNVIESSDGLRVDCDFNTDLFDEATIDRWLRYYDAVLDAMATDASTAVDGLTYLPAGEQLALVVDGANAADSAHSDPEARVHELFEASTARNGAAIAMVCGDVSLTYAELDGRANRLAAALVAQTAPGDLVGIGLERSVDILVALLGTLKAGCAYVPLDLRYPEARLRAVLTDAAVKAVVIDDAQTAPSFAAPGIALIDVSTGMHEIDDVARLRANRTRSADDLAYVMYTSGSTGTPKGVEITHRSVVNLLRSMAREPGLRSDDVLLAVTTIAFDIAALELFLPLAVGGTVVIATGDEAMDGARLLERLVRAEATAMQATPSTWRMLLEAGFSAPPGFVMLCGGEALPRDLANRLLEGPGRLWNMYGPTETTIWSSCAEIQPGDATITVGRPIANTQFYVLDANDRPVGVGQTGELHIGGAGVARGYVNRASLTAEKFIPSPFGPGSLYRTGDLARLLESGDTQVLGRIDDQIKLRGFRIELGEIEAALSERAGVAASAAALREDASGTSRLVGYFVNRPGEARTPAELTAAVADVLPAYMIPSAWVQLGALPLTPNGKLDRKALPVPEAVAGSDDEYVEPRTPLERVLATIWSSVLKCERVGIDDDLFALGADSIHVFAITARANREGIPLLAKQLLAHRTIARLALHLEAHPALPIAAPVALTPRLPNRAAVRERLESSA